MSNQKSNLNIYVYNSLSSSIRYNFILPVKAFDNLNLLDNDSKEFMIRNKIKYYTIDKIKMPYIIYTWMYSDLDKYICRKKLYELKEKIDNL